MEPKYDALSLATLETVNRVARAAHLWIRHKQAAAPFVPSTTVVQADHELAAGVISGLCDALNLDGQHALLSAYAYALLEGEDDQALHTAHALFEQGSSTAEAIAYREGKLMALEIIGVVQFSIPADPTPVTFSAEASCGRAASQIVID
jgi:hypothetical protein